MASFVPSVLSFSTSCLLSKGLRFLTQTKRHGDKILQIIDSISHYVISPEGVMQQLQLVIIITLLGGCAVVQLVDALRYQQEGRGFDS